MVLVHRNVTTPGIARTVQPVRACCRPRRPDRAGRRRLKRRAGRAGSLGREEPCARRAHAWRAACSARPGPQLPSARTSTTERRGLRAVQAGRNSRRAFGGPRFQRDWGPHATEHEQAEQRGLRAEQEEPRFKALMVRAVPPVRAVCSCRPQHGQRTRCLNARCAEACARATEIARTHRSDSKTKRQYPSSKWDIPKRKDPGSLFGNSRDNSVWIILAWNRRLYPRDSCILIKGRWIDR
jgi:hypothetical protein